MKLEIGGGHAVRPGWYNLDPVHGYQEVGMDLRMKAQDAPWPIIENGVTEIMASHVMEHIPSGQARIDVMNECHRVLAPGGEMTVFVPNCLSPTWEAYADPTHISYWCLESFHYFDGHFQPNADYGIKFWETKHLAPQEGWPAIIHWVGTPR